MTYIKEKLKKILPQSLYNLIRNFYHNLLNYSFSLSLIYSFIEYLFYRKKIKKVDCNLILISQIQRSGGSLLTQLLDGHTELYNYPSELILTSPKFNWFGDVIWRNDELIFNTMKTNNHLKICYINKNYHKKGKGNVKKATKNLFLYNPFLEKKIFSQIIKNNNNAHKDLRFLFNSYFTSFFNSFLNYKNSVGEKKFISAFLPRFIHSENNIEKFFSIYPDGFLILIIRDPETWLKSAKKHSIDYENTKLSLDLWLKSLKNSIQCEKKYKEKIILISFESLIKNTNITLDKVCKILNIEYESCLETPTFNKEHINSDSSFERTIGTVDTNVLKQNYNFSNEEKIILKNYIKEYEQIKHLLI